MALTLAAAAVTASSTAAAAGAPRRIAVCQVRACLLVLSPKSDTDGDGVADVDERQLGTDPTKATSVPAAGKLLDAVTRRTLPSFENHLTEVVELPQVTPSGKALMTGFGPFGLPTKPSRSLYPTIGSALDQLGAGGVDLGFGVTAFLPSQPVPAGPDFGPSWGVAGRMALVADGSTCVVRYGDEKHSPNGGAGGDNVTEGIKGSNGSPDQPPFHSSSDGFTYDHNYTVTHGNGTTDTVHATTDEYDHTTVSTIYSYDDTGTMTAKTTVINSDTTYADGSTATNQTIVTTNYDKNGNSTGGTTTSTSTTKTATGTSATGATVYTVVTTTVTYTTNPDGSANPPTDPPTVTTEQVEDPPPADDPTAGGDPNGGGMYDPDSDPTYVSSGPITTQDLSLVIARLNATRTPGPDNGDTTPIQTPPTSKWPMVALINGDGVTVLASGYTPNFNRSQPEYDPRLTELGGISGSPTPRTGTDGTISWGH